MHGITDDSGTTYQFQGYSRDTELVEAFGEFVEESDMNESQAVILALRQLLQRECYND